MLMCSIKSVLKETFMMWGTLDDSRRGQGWPDVLHGGARRGQPQGLCAGFYCGPPFRGEPEH